MEFDTLAIHAGQEPEASTGAVTTPIFQTSTYKQDGVGRPRSGYEYSRTKNPTRSALESCVATLEAGTMALAFASGMAATDTVLRLLESGAHVVAGNDVYGGTFRLFDKVLRGAGLTFDFVDTTDPEIVADTVSESTRMIWLESPSNPLLRVSNIQAIAHMIETTKSKPLLVVDNTFATPYLQRPLTLGADIVIHSSTKYLGGHSDAIGGIVVVRDSELHSRLAFLQNAVGAVPGPMDCFLILRGVKTLPVRMERHAKNASAIAERLARHPKVEQAHYPFLPGHPQTAVARQQMRNGGGMVSFSAKGGVQAATRAAEALQLFTLAESLGGVESLVEVPAAMTHLSTSDTGIAVDPALIRLSVGLEDPEDLWEDLERALAQA